MLRKMTSQLMRTTAIAMLPVAVMAPAAAFAQTNGSGPVSCTYDGVERTINVVAKTGGVGCEVRYDSGDGSGERVLWSAANSVGFCRDKADGLASKLTNSGFTCSSPAMMETRTSPPVKSAPATMTTASAAPIAVAASASAGASQTSTAADSGDQGDFSFDIAEKAAEPPKPVYVNEVEFGVGWVSDDSAEFGEFSGLESRGPFVVGNVNIQKRAPYDSDSTEYFITRGTNLGLESRSVYAEYGRQGHFSIFGEYDSIPRFLHDDAMTPFIFRDNNTNLTLPAGWVASDRDNSGLTLLNSSLHDFNISHQREKAGGGFSWLPGDAWSVRSSFYRETKQGTRTIAAIFGQNGGDPAGMIVPEPIDYETDNFDASIAYNGKRGQFALSYNLSLFRDNNTSLIFQNPYASSRWAPEAGFPDGFGQMSLPPDNHAHRITFVGKYLLTSKTRAMAQINYSRMTQDEMFLPYTINPSLMAPVPLPRASLQGEINTWTADIGMVSQLTPQFSIATSYRYENRDNKTPQDVFLVVHNDSVDQATIDEESARINRPYGRKQHLAKVDATYRFSSKSKVTFGYEFEQLERDFTEVAKTKEHKVHGKFQTTPTIRTSAWVGAEYSSRNGSDYIDNLPFLISLTPEFKMENPDDDLSNHPLLRKYYIADRNRLKINGGANWTPHDDFNIAVFGHYNKDDYDKSVLGLTKTKLTSITGDVSYQPSDRVNYHLFYTYDRNEYWQSGLSYRGGASLETLLDIDANGWNVDTRDRVDTAGAGLQWDVVKDKLNFSVDYYYSHANTNFDFAGGTGLTFGPAPDLETRLHSVESVAEYQVSDQFWFKVRYLYSHNNVTDFALDGIDPDTMRFIIGLGNQAPSYNVHVVGFSAVYKF